MAHLAISLPTPFSVPLTLSFLRRSPREALHRLDGDDVIKLFAPQGAPLLTRITFGDKQLRVLFPERTPTTPEREFIRQYVTDWFDLATDLSPFYKLAKKDALLAPLVKKFSGYRIVGQPDLFESLVWAVLGQQINVAFAYTLKQRFVEQFGQRHEFGGHPHYLFPTPEVVSRLTDDDLLPLQFSRQKSLYVRQLGQAFADGTLVKEKIGALSFDEAKEALMRVKGIGNWTANYALMKTFRYPNAFPLEDAGVHNAIKNLKGLPQKPTLDQVKRVFKPYQGWEAYATLYLWKSL